MRNIVYYVACSIDGFISGPNEDISGFVPGGDGVDQYLQDLKAFDTVIMGRKTYEFGYKFGLEPGLPAYEHMDNYIFSEKLKFKTPHKKVKVCKLDLDFIKKLKRKKGSDIYLCGGGAIAGWLLDHKLIDFVNLKLNPFVQGKGTPLFGLSNCCCQLDLLSHKQYEHGLQIIKYKVKY